VFLYPEDGPVSRNELLELYRSLVSLFPLQTVQSADIKALSHPAVAVRVALFINVGTDPLEHLSRSGKQLTTNQHDPLSFSSSHTNLALNFEELLQTSWGELLISGRQGEAGLLDTLCNTLNMFDEQMPPPRFHAYSFSSIRGDLIAERVVELFNHVVDYFSVQTQRDSRYAFRLGKAYFLVQREHERFTWRSQDRFASLLYELSRPQVRFRGLSFDPEILGDTPYPTLYRLNRPDVIQLFFQVLPRQMQIYLLDEQGALFHQTLAVDSPRYLMLQQRRFLNSLQQLRNLLPGAAQPCSLDEPEFYELRHEYLSGWIAESRSVPMLRHDDYMELTLVIDRFEPDAQPLSLICGNREFGWLEYGEDIYAATANYLRAQREGNADYPIYLTSLSHSGLPVYQPPATVVLLELKKRVEQRLNRSGTDAP
jgi:adenylate cyclase class 1